ncbi:MAG: DUF1573 domain-containing protein [Verrucomicrobiota bacterium]
MKFAIGVWLTLAAFSQAAGLEFTELFKDINAAADAATITTDFNFTNKSDKPVTITKAEPSCPCLKAEISGGKLKYAPNESGVIRITFEMGNLAGLVVKDLPIYVDHDPPDKPSILLTVRVHIPVLVALEPKTVKWNLGGKPDPQTIQIRMAEGKPIHVKSVKSSSPEFSCELKALEEGRKFDLIVTPLKMNAPEVSIFRIETDCGISKHRIQQAFAVVRKLSPGEVALAPKEQAGP